MVSCLPTFMPICLEGMVPNQKLPRCSPWAPEPRKDDSVAACLTLWAPSLQERVLILDQNGSTGTACFLTADLTCWQDSAKPKERKLLRRSVSRLTGLVGPLRQILIKERKSLPWIFWWGPRLATQTWSGFIAGAEGKLFPAGSSSPV